MRKVHTLWSVDPYNACLKVCSVKSHLWNQLTGNSRSSSKASSRDPEVISRTSSIVIWTTEGEIASLFGTHRWVFNYLLTGKKSSSALGSVSAQITTLLNTHLKRRSKLHFLFFSCNTTFWWSSACAVPHWPCACGFTSLYSRIRAGLICRSVLYIFLWSRYDY